MLANAGEDLAQHVASRRGDGYAYIGRSHLLDVLEMCFVSALFSFYKLL